VTDTMPAVQSPQPRREVAVAKPDMLAFGTIAEVMRFAETIQRADGMIPKHMIGNPGKIVATVMAGHELGVGPMASLRAFHVVEGKPCADYSFWVARLKAAGYRLEWPERSMERCTLKMTSPDGSTATETWDKARAVTAGLWGKAGPWKNHPQTMLSARCVTSLGRAFAAEVMFGCYETSEADEIIRDAELVQAEGGTPQAGSVTDRVAAVVGAAVDAEARAIESRARECSDMAKALGYTRDSMFGLMDSLAIPRSRLSEMSRDQLDRIAEALDEVAKKGAAVDADREPGVDA